MGPITGKYAVIHKTGSTERIAMPSKEDRATTTVNSCTVNLVKFACVVLEICSRTDRQTDRQSHHNISLPHTGGSN